MILLTIISWIVCGVATYGIWTTWAQGMFPAIAYRDRYNDRIFGGLIALFGPFGLLATTIVIGVTTGFRYGWRL